MKTVHLITLLHLLYANQSTNAMVLNRFTILIFSVKLASNLQSQPQIERLVSGHAQQTKDSLTEVNVLIAPLILKLTQRMPTNVSGLMHVPMQDSIIIQEMNA